jgi:hypothetical protein
MASPVVVQFGLGVMKPFQPRFARCTGISARLLEVHARDEDGHVGLVAGRPTPSDRTAAPRPARLELARRLALQRREDQPHAVGRHRRRVLDRQLGEPPSASSRAARVPAHLSARLAQRLGGSACPPSATLAAS